MFIGLYNSPSLKENDVHNENVDIKKSKTKKIIFYKIFLKKRAFLGSFPLKKLISIGFNKQK